MTRFSARDPVPLPKGGTPALMRASCRAQRTYDSDARIRSLARMIEACETVIAAAAPGGLAQSSRLRQMGVSAYRAR